ncbi:MAG TPA: zf-HC2 domain-containing protein [Pyrinomonadaceae bacterium]
MSEHLTDEQFKQYRAGRMSPVELLRLDEHFANCASCRERVRTGEQLVASFASLTADLGIANASTGAHISYEQLADLVDGRLDGEASGVVNNHLRACAACAEEARSLAAFRDSLTAEEVATPGPARPLYERLRNLFAFPRPAAAWGLVAAALLLAVVGAAWLGRSYWGARTTPEAARVTPKSSPERVSSEGNVAAKNVDGEARTGTATTDVPPLPTPSPGADTTARATVTLRDGGGSITLNSDGELKGVGWLSPSQAGAVKDALANGRVTTPGAFAAPGAGRDTLLGDSPEVGGSKAFALAYPVGAVVASPRPRFAWRPLAGAERYVVDVYDDTFRKVATSGDVSGTEWTPASDLKRGAVYSWEVTAYSADGSSRAPAPPAPEARFRVLDESREREIRRAERAAPRSHLALGVLYARAGLLDEAEREFQLLTAANPRSAAARRLLRDVRARKRRGGR